MGYFLKEHSWLHSDMGYFLKEHSEKGSSFDTSSTLFMVYFAILFQASVPNWPAILSTNS